MRFCFFSSLLVFFRSSYAVNPTHYTIRHGLQDGRRRMRSWHLQGSTDDRRWVTLKSHDEDQSLAAAGFSSHTWPVGWQTLYVYNE